VRKEQVVAVVMIGVDPHKGSHTAVAVDGDEVVLGLVRVRASAAQAQRLLEWAAQWPTRTWAVEGAAGLGHLLAQELVAAGERALEPGKLADLTVLDTDPVAAALEQLDSIGLQPRRPRRRPGSAAMSATQASAE
jgi:hypothetical protein